LRDGDCEGDQVGMEKFKQWYLLSLFVGVVLVCGVFWARNWDLRWLGGLL